MERYFHPAAKRAGLPATLRMHDPRHTAASLLIREGASIKALQKMLGHKDAVQTLNRYGHLYPDELEALAERLEQVHQRAPGGSDGPDAAHSAPVWAYSMRTPHQSSRDQQSV